ncbi:energy transducer TonB [Neolewinella lacunae]|uniref:Energy transducer TonB n=1 Tax=Neolewinella lacunae TaxID=1517758 RepID=A0A923PMM3_9BACT|nr:energy transducer TonB [Neolewinella lacunae]MBC6993322.1 energy transducer TonB [Neolewinella lacunae]MDN3636837.1 energy transducer TonB [Neolewinella lacunae]
MQKLFTLFLFILMVMPTLSAQNSCACTEVDETATIHKVVQQMPLFSGCSDHSYYPERQQCATREMLDFIYSNQIYPNAAYEKGTQGMVVVSFIVEVDGCLNDIKIVRSIGDGCDEEALRLVKLMQAQGSTFDPGFNDGRIVRVQFNLPIRFRIDENTVVQGNYEPDYDPKCFPVEYFAAEFERLELSTELSQWSTKAGLISLNIKSLDRFEGRVEIFSSDSTLQYFVERPFEYGETTFTISVDHLPKGEKYLLLSSKGGEHELAKIDFVLEY